VVSTALVAPIGSLHEFAHNRSWPTTAVSARLRYRITDAFVREFILEKRHVKVPPLSVSSDRIAVCAWRCASILRQYADRTGWKLDRVGAGVHPQDTDAAATAQRATPTGAVVEVYPAAALALWGMPHKGYKPAQAAKAQEGRDKRAAIIETLEDIASSWLSLEQDVRALCILNDDAFDALICALVSFAAASDLTMEPLPSQRAQAEREGWIQLPFPDSLETIPIVLGQTSRLIGHSRS
jgi:hypothetical protein